jgi:hypothetical protein
MLTFPLILEVRKNSARLWFERIFMMKAVEDTLRAPMQQMTFNYVEGSAMKGRTTMTLITQPTNYAK